MAAVNYILACKKNSCAGDALQLYSFNTQQIKRFYLDLSQVTYTLYLINCEFGNIEKI